MQYNTNLKIVSNNDNVTLHDLYHHKSQNVTRFLRPLERDILFGRLLKLRIRSSNHCYELLSHNHIISGK